MKSCGILVFFSLAIVLSSISSSECRYVDEEGSRFNCGFTEIHFGGQCYDACNFRANIMGAPCVENAYCYVSAAHTATCVCSDGYSGDASFGKCSKIN